jgi:hypothetical protein
MSRFPYPRGGICGKTTPLEPKNTSGSPGREPIPPNGATSQQWRVDGEYGELPGPAALSALGESRAFGRVQDQDSSSPRGLHCAPVHRLSRRHRARHSPRQEGTRRIGIPDEGAGPAAGLGPPRQDAGAFDPLARQAGTRRQARDSERRPPGHLRALEPLASLRHGARRLARSPARRATEAAVRPRDDRPRHEPRRAIAAGRLEARNAHVALAPRRRQPGRASDE